MTLEEFEKIAKDIEAKSDFIISWWAKKYNKTIFRIGSMNKEGCRTWEQDGKKKKNAVLVCLFSLVVY